VNLFDALALMIVVVAVIAGIRTGALPQVGGIAGAIGGLVISLALAPQLVDATRGLEPIARALVVLGCILGAVLVGEAVGSGLGRVMAGGLREGVMSGMDRVAGGFLGALQAILIVWLVGGLLAAGPFPSLGRAATQSTVVQQMDRFLPPPTEVVGEIAGVLEASGLPDVFVGLDPAPLPSVDLPTEGVAGRIAGASASSVARVTAGSCGTQVAGTGVAIAPEYLVTNAHVVAGASVVRVAHGSSILDAAIVLLDPELDVAVLRVPGLDAPALSFASDDPPRGTTGAVLGYAGGGALVVLRAAVAGGYPATGRDIYNDHVVTRDILELRAPIEPGDSGGPLVLEDGSIGGLVFAESRTDPAIGYALSPASVARRVMPAIGSTAEVGAGDCIR
jgi:S1-C subfamily serine protease